MADDQTKSELALDLASKNAQSIATLAESQIKTESTLSTLVTTVDKVDKTMSSFIQQSTKDQSWRNQLPLLAIMVSMIAVALTIGGLVMTPVKEDIYRNEKDFGTHQANHGHSQTVEDLSAINTRLAAHSQLLEILDQHSRNNRNQVETIARLVEQIRVAQADISQLQDGGWSRADHDQYTQSLNERLALMQQLYQHQLDALYRTIQEDKDDLDAIRP